METRIIVCGIVVKGDEILLGKKTKGQPPYPDVWHTLGGGVKDLEKATKLLKEKKYDDPYFHEELKRELKEEASISVKKIKNICPDFKKQPREGITKNKHGVDTHYIFLEYICEYDKGDAKHGDDIAELKWVSKDQLKNVPLTKPSQEMYSEMGWI